MYDEDDIDENQDEEGREEDDVRCARCRKWVPAFATRCPECNFDFEGQAQDYEAEDEEYRSVFYGKLGSGLPLWVILTAIVLLALMIFGIFEWGIW